MPALWLRHFQVGWAGVAFRPNQKLCALTSYQKVQRTPNFNVRPGSGALPGTVCVSTELADYASASVMLSSLTYQSICVVLAFIVYPAEAFHKV